MSEISNSSEDDSIYLNSEEESNVELLRERIIKMHREKADLEKKYDNLNNSLITDDFTSMKNDIVDLVEPSLCCGFNSKYKLKKLELNNEATGDPFSLLNELISLINKIKNKLSKLNELSINYETIIDTHYQDKDDLIFYKSMILDSKKFFIPSFRIRKKKIVNDINKILKLFGFHNIRYLNNIDSNTIKIIKDNFTQLIIEIKEGSKKNNTKWIKDNKLKCLDTINSEMYRTFIYHINVNTHFLNSISSEVNFYSIK